MKKSLIALAAVAASGAAFAQSSVTLFGVVDAAVTHVNGKENWNGMTNSGTTSSRLGFRGVEDLGNGLKAEFWLEGALSNDDGTGFGAGKNTKNSDGGFSFQRRSTVGLHGSFGEVRLGRDLTAAYSATQRYDVFGDIGVGAAGLWEQNRQNNMVAYYTPNFAGFKLGLNYGFGESKDGYGKSSTSASAYAGAALTYDNGPLSLGLGYEQLNDGEQPIADGSLVYEAEKRTSWSLGGSYDFGVAKLAAVYTQDKYKAVNQQSSKENGYLIAISAPVGAAGLVKASYNHYEEKEAGSFEKLKANKFSLGYVHSLSKRTAVYTTYSYIKNKNNAAGDNMGKVLVTGTTLKDSGKQQAIQVGVRHSF